MVSLRLFKEEKMITPLDIENKKFSKQMMNGYNVEEVDDFLDDLTAYYGRNYKEITELRTKVEELNKSLEHYKTIEKTLQDTLIMAQTTAEDIKNVAKQQADQIINEAKAKAEEILRDSRETSKRTLDEIEQQITSKQKTLEDLKKQFDNLKKQGQIEFVTFHQSYSYEEFVEGIKPYIPEWGTVEENNRFIRQDGIFKKICNSAKTTIEGNFEKYILSL